MATEKELTMPVKLCRADGTLNPEAVGWSRTPLHTCNLSGRWPRKKRWNYWAVTNERYLFSVTVSNVDYTGLVFIYVADFAKDLFQEVTHMALLGQGCDLPEMVNADVYFEGGGMRVAMVQTKSGVDLQVDIVDFEGAPLAADLAISIPSGHETLNVVIPWDERTFQFTSKQNTLPARGMVTLGGETMAFDDEGSFACLDYGRGIWPRDCTWNWGSASGLQDGRTLGLNLGGQWTDGTGYTENGICLGSRLSKISEPLQWRYDKSNFMRPWRINAPSGAVDLTFTPFMERVAASNLWLVKSEVHQMFGRYNGSVTAADGEVVPVRNLLGWAEDHVAKW